jgi:chromosome partitioning protein
MDKLLRLLSRRMGFRLQPGLSERVVFREMFYDGLTLLDPPVAVRGQDVNPGARARARALAGLGRARREVEDLAAALCIERLEPGLGSGQAPA